MLTIAGKDTQCFYFLITFWLLALIHRRRHSLNLRISVPQQAIEFIVILEYLLQHSSYFSHKIIQQIFRLTLLALALPRCSYLDL